jgi:hypothetical protein
MLIFVMPVNASIHSVSGYILENGEAIPWGTVTDNESIDITTSNSTGYYKLEGYTNQMSYIIIASKPGYTSNSLQVDFLDADINNHNISMSKISLTSFLTDLTSIVTSLTSIFNGVMVIFMEPPLNLFIGVVLFVLTIGIVGRYLKGRKG